MSGIPSSAALVGRQHRSDEEIRYRVGLILPSSNSALEWEFGRQLPRWSSLHAARMFHTDADFGSLQRTHDAIPAAASMIATVKPHLVVIGCTAVSGLGNGQFEDEVVPRIEGIVNAPVLTVLPAVIDSLRRAHCRQVVLITPHGADIDTVLVEALEGRSIAVRETHSMEIRDNFELGQIPPARIYRFIHERLTRPLEGDEAMFLSCTNFRSAEALPGLHRRYGPRVISSVQAVIDSTLAKLQKLRGHPPGGVSRTRQSGCDCGSSVARMATRPEASASKAMHSDDSETTR